MNTIETLKRLSPGRYDMKEVAAASGENACAAEVGRQVRELAGRIFDGVAVAVSRTGRRVMVSLTDAGR